MRIEYLPQGGRGKQWRITEGLTDARVSRVDAAGALFASGPPVLIGQGTQFMHHSGLGWTPLDNSDPEGDFNPADVCAAVFDRTAGALVVADQEGLWRRGACPERIAGWERVGRAQPTFRDHGGQRSV